MDANKLTSPNFLDWLKNFRIVLKGERITHVLDSLLSLSLVIDASIEDQKAYQEHLGDSELAR